MQIHERQYLQLFKKITQNKMQQYNFITCLKTSYISLNNKAVPLHLIECNCSNIYKYKNEYLYIFITLYTN